MNDRMHLRSSRCAMSMLVLLLVGGAGCTSPLQKMEKKLTRLGDARLERLLTRSLVAGGGMKAWAETALVEGVALATYIEPDGCKSVVEQNHKFFCSHRLVVSVTSREPGGVVSEQLDRRGRVKMQFEGGPKPIDIKDEEQLYGAGLKLRLQGQAITGAAGLLQKGLRLVYAGRERKGGRWHEKIELAGPLVQSPEAIGADHQEMLAVWIDASTFLIDRLWLRYRQVGSKDRFGYLAANVSDYRQTASGLVLPHRIEFIRSDQYQQFSEQHILVIDYQNLDGKTETGQEKSIPALVGSFLAKPIHLVGERLSSD